MALTYLVIGSGGREHALAWALSRADGAMVHVAPGHDGIRQDPDIQGQCFDVQVDDFPGLLKLAQSHHVDLVVVGPEVSLVHGIVDFFDQEQIPIWGPSKNAARLEASKRFAKQLMADAGIPTASWQAFDDLEQALAAVHTRSHPLVIKASGLAGGKGSIISPSIEQSIQTIRAMMQDELFGVAGREIILESYLAGRELSFIVATDGERVFPFESSQDHKPVGEGDVGPNTGGMGAVSPSTLMTPALHTMIMDDIVHPVLNVMRARQTPFVGFLYVGIMVVDGRPQVLEFNVRMGDPEAQALLYALEPDDFGATLLSILKGEEVSREIFSSERHACCVVMASRGYPSSIQKKDLNHQITGIDNGLSARIFHAATRFQDGHWYNHGGRVLGVTANGDSLNEAIENAYVLVTNIDWPGHLYRRDIGHSAKTTPKLELV